MRFNPPALVVRRSLLLLALFAIAAFFSGCATVTRGTTEQITINSEPTGATVRLSNGFTGITPAVFTVPRKGDIIATISKEGYETTTVTLTPHVAGAGTAGFVGNALIGGIIGGGVDIATGATLSHTPNPALVTLSVARVPEKMQTAPLPEPASATPPAPTVAPKVEAVAVAADASVKKIQ